MSKKCPYCAELIQDEAVVCRFCNRSLSQSETKLDKMLAALAEQKNRGEISGEQYAEMASVIQEAYGNENQKSKFKDYFGFVILMVPVVSLTILGFAYMKVTQEMLLIQAHQILEEAKILYYVSSVTLLLGSAILVGIDSSYLGFGKKSGTSGTNTSPFVLAISQIFIWLIAFPYYLHLRRKANRNAQRLLFAGIAITLLTVAAYAGFYYVHDQRAEAINSQLSEIRQRVNNSLEHFNRNLGQTE